MKAHTNDGAEIFYELYDFTDPWEPADTIILHHGQRANHSVWHAWIPPLAKEYRVLALDARGRGGSSVPPPGFEWSLEQFATDVLAVLDDAGVERVHFIGNSFGSAIGEYFAATYPERLRTLSLVSAPYRFDHLKHVIDGWLADMEQLGTLEFLRQDVPNMFPENANPAMVEWHVQQMANVPDHVTRDLMTFMANVNLADLLPRIPVPTLLLAAAKSDRAPAGESEFMHQRIPNSRLVTFDSHHHIMVTVPEQCVTVILEFLAEHRSV